jgi:phage terminase large subunit-like protein
MTNYLQEYYNEIINGKIIAGQEMILELRNLVEDLKNPRYKYDTTEAEARIIFMETCCKQSKKPFYLRPLKLLLWQKAFLEALYSFQIYDEELGRWKKRFNEALLLIARKNGKTTFMAGDAEYDLWVGDGGQDIVCGSNDDKTANLLWSEIEGMRSRLDPKMRWTHKNLMQIENLSTETKVFKMSGKSQNKDGRNIDKFLFDESHDAPDDELANAGKKSQSAKEEPMFINLTTEGFGVKDCYLDRKLIYARAIINKEIDDETFLPWLYTQDSENEIWQDENSWYKSNPSLGVIKKWSQLRSEIEKSKLDKTTRVHTLTKDFNIKQNSAEAWLMPEDYQYEATFNLEDFRDSFGVGAVDLSETSDLTCAKILLMKKNDPTKYVFTKYWIPEAKLSDSDDKKAGAKYEEWIKDDLIELTQGTDNDVSKVADWFASLKKKYNIRCIAVGYDVRSSKPFTDRMDDYGIEIVKVLQNRYTLSEPMKLVERDLKLRVLNYNENPIDQWCFGNAVIDIDTMCRIMCIKLEQQKRIDGAVTTIILYWMFREYKDEILRKLK